MIGASHASLDSGLDPHPSPLPNGEGEGRFRLAWIPAPHRGTGHAFDLRNDEFGGGNESSGIGVRDMLSYEDWRRSCLPRPSGFRPRIGVRGMLLTAGITMALRRSHKRMKMGRRVSFFHRLVALPLPTPSGFRPSPE